MTQGKDQDALAVQVSREQTSISQAVSDRGTDETAPVPASTALEPIDDWASHSSRVVRVSKVDITGRFKSLAGSDSSAFNESLIQHVFKSLPWENVEVEDRVRLAEAMTGAMKGIAPRDEIEGMIAGLLVSLNFAVLEYVRRAHADDRLFNQATKGVRTMATLVEALNRYRGKVQQKVTVKHVHVNDGGQAIVGSVETGKGSKNQSPRKRGAGKPNAD